VRTKGGNDGRIESPPPQGEGIKGVRTKGGTTDGLSLPSPAGRGDQRGEEPAHGGLDSGSLGRSPFGPLTVTSSNRSDGMTYDAA